VHAAAPRPGSNRGAVAERSGEYPPRTACGTLARVSSPYRNGAETLTFAHEGSGVRYEYTLSSTHLAVEWRSSTGLGRSETALQELSPEIQYFEGKSAGDPAAAERSLLALGLAAVVFFSSIQGQVPLLAPFLLAVSVFYARRVVRASKRSKWSVVRHKDDRQIATIDHSGTNGDELDSFLAALRERVKASRSATSIDAPAPLS
jgi:hypothetical protein